MPNGNGEDLAAVIAQLQMQQQQGGVAAGACPQLFRAPRQPSMHRPRKHTPAKVVMVPNPGDGTPEFFRYAGRFMAGSRDGQIVKDVRKVARDMDRACGVTTHRHTRKRRSRKR